jgi:putative spermidine/putrescine transport system substrate-binding protein
MRAYQQRFRGFVALAATAALLAACGSDSGGSSSTEAPASEAPATEAPATTAGGGATTAAAGPGTTAAAGADLSALYAACKAEGQVNLIALPDDWANYKGILQSFRDKYPGVKNPVANPEFSSQEELDAIKNLAGQEDMPHSIDVSPAKAQDAIAAGYFEPFKPTTLDQVPDGLKDPADNWVGAYYGIIALTTNTTVVKNAPKTFADLKKPEYKGKVALNDDPRKAGAAFAGVMAASLANSRARRRSPSTGATTRRGCSRRSRGRA